MTDMQIRTDLEAKEKVWNLIKDISVALLATRSAEGHLHARPMVARQERFDGVLWFFTPLHCRKVEEIKADPEVLLSYSRPEDQHYVSVSGQAEIVYDRGVIAELWTEPMRTWFPKGIDDPNLVALKVTVESAEYWDVPSSALVYAYGYAKARLTGKSPKMGDIAHVDFEKA